MRFSDNHEKPAGVKSAVLTILQSSEVDPIVIVNVIVRFERKFTGYWIACLS